MNPFTRMKDEYQTQVFLANKTGVTSSTDQENVSLHVKGDVSISNRLHLTELVADSFMETSDERKKNILNKLDELESVEFLKKLQPIEFEWKKNNKPAVGYSAQSVQKINPKLVKDSGEGLSLSYSSINVHTTNALIHLLKQIKS